MNELVPVHTFRNAGLGVVTDAIVFDTACYMNDLVHTFKAAGLGAVTNAIIFDIVC